MNHQQKMMASSGGNKSRTAIQFPVDDDEEIKAELPEEEFPPVVVPSLSGVEEVFQGIDQDQGGAQTPKGVEPVEEVNCSDDAGGGGDECDDDDDGSSSEDEEEEDDNDDADDDRGARSGGVDMWKQEDGEGISCHCFICDHSTFGYEAADLMKDHVERAHQLSFQMLKSTFKMDHLAFVQFVRWARDMRRQGCVEERIDKLVTSPSVDGFFQGGEAAAATPPPWTSTDYLLPSGSEEEEDYFLTLDFFALDEDTNCGPAQESLDDRSSASGLVTQIRQLRLEKEQMKQVLHRILADNNMNQSESSEISGAFSLHTTPSAHGQGQPMPELTSRTDDNDNYDKRGKKTRGTATDDVNPHFGLSQPTHNALYFESYNDIEIHHEMIFDLSRTNAYRSAILQRKDDIEGGIILDVGCGSGILSMFCAQQGAEMVHAVDNSQIIYDAMSNAFENDFDSKITFHRIDIDKEEDGIPAADVLISEFMGYFLFFEGMTETFVRARDKYLKPGGIVMPNKCSVELVPLGPTGLYKDKVQCWDNVYGFRMPVMQARASLDPIIDTVRHPSDMIGSAVTVKELDLSNCKVSDVYMDQEFELHFTSSTQFCAMAGFFSVTFSGGSKNRNSDDDVIILSTAPWDPPTHWKQAIFFLPTPIDVKAGEKLSGRIKSHPHPENCRWLVAEIWIGETYNKYEFR